MRCPIRCCETWLAPHGLPPFAAIRPEPTSSRPSWPPCSAHRDELRRIDRPHRPSPRPSTTPWPPSTAAGGCSARVGAVFYNLTASETQRRPAGRAAPHGRTAGRPRQRRLSGRAVVCSASITLHAASATALGLAPEQLPAARSHPPRLRAGRRPPAGARRASVTPPSWPQLAELTTRFAQNVLHDESTWRLALLQTEADLAGLPDFVRASARQAAAGARPGRRAPDHAVAVAGRSLPHLFHPSGPTCASRPGVPGRRAAKTKATADNREVARGILRLRNEQARLHGHASLRRLRAGRHHGRPPAARCNACSTKSGRARLTAVSARTARRCRQQMACRGCRQSRSRPGTGASGPRRCARRATRSTMPRSSRTSSSNPWCRRPSIARGACSAFSFTAAGNDLPVYHPDVRAYEVA